VEPMDFLEKTVEESDDLRLEQEETLTKGERNGV
jgi:hypothetical protein